MLEEFTLGIGSGLLTDLIKHGGERFLDSTLMGTKLKEKLGLLDNTAEDKFKKLLLEAYVIYFSRYPNRQFQVFYEFFSSEDISKCLFDYVFNFQPIRYSDLEQLLQNKMGKDWILFRILERDSLTIQKVIEDFINCYSDAEKKSAGMDFFLTLREIRQSEQRIIEKTAIELNKAGDRIVDSIIGDFSNRLVALEDELKRIGVNTKDLPSLHLLDRDARRVETAIHELAVIQQAIIAISENLLMDSQDISGVPAKVIKHIEDLMHYTHILHYTMLNTMGYADIAGYRFVLTNIDTIISDIVGVYKPIAQNKEIAIKIKLRPKNQLLELSWAIHVAINNIINNALEFSARGEPGKLRQIVVSGERINSLYKITVSNFGVGILLEEQDKIFEDGYRGESAKRYHRVGMGRGLYVAKAIVEQHNGKISLSSNKQDAGYLTTFEIILPLRQPAKS